MASRLMETSSTDQHTPQRRAQVAAVLAIVTVLLFWPVARCEFLLLDDPDYVTENEWVSRGLTWTGVVQAFRDVQTANWHPVTWLSHMLDVELFGLNPTGHHLMNLLFHTANGVLLFLLLGRMTGALWRSAMVAALFAWHPLRVESVAWVAERKDVLSAFFFLLTVWAYGRYTEDQRGKGAEEQRRQGWRASLFPFSPFPLFYFLALLFFALGLMSKPMVVTLPFVLLLLDYWPLQRFSIHDLRLTISMAGSAEGRRNHKSSILNLKSGLLREKIPFFGLSLAGCVVAYGTQAKAGSVTEVTLLPLGTRLTNAVASYFGYVQTTLWPADLAVFYPYTGGPGMVKLFLMGAALAGFTALVVWFASRRRYLAVGWFWFLGMLVPVIGLVQIGLQARADRYTYLPQIGLCVIAAWGAGELVQRAVRGRRFLILLLVLAVAGYGLSARQQLRYWENGVVLFTRALTVTPKNAFAHYNLAVALAARGETDQACEHFVEAVASNPDHAETLNNVGLCLVMDGQGEAGMEYYRRALALKPEYPEAHYNLGLALAARGDLDGGIAQYREAVRLRPGFVEARTRLGLALIQAAQPVEAATHFQAVVESRPDAQAHRHLGSVLVLLNNPADAVKHYREALRLRPDWPEMLNLLAWLLATHGDAAIRNGAEAVALAERACALSQATNANFLATLAAAYAETGRFPDAVKTSERAVELATAAGQTELAGAERKRLAVYQQNQPFHQE